MQILKNRNYTTTKVYSLKKCEIETGTISNIDKEYISNIGNVAMAYYKSVSKILDTTEHKQILNHYCIIYIYKKNITLANDKIIKKDEKSDCYQFIIRIENPVPKNQTNILTIGLGIVLSLLAGLIIYKMVNSKGKRSV